MFDDSEQLVWSNIQSTGVMLPGFNGSFENFWIPSQAGSYSLQVTLETQLSYESAVILFEVTPLTPQISLSGQINQLPAGVILGQSWSSAYSVNNNGEIDVLDIPVILSLWDSQLNQLIDQEITNLSIVVSDSSQLMVTWSSDNLVLSNYVLVLTADMSSHGGSASFLLDTLTIQTVDTTGPQINLINPVEQGFYLSSLDFRAEIIDAHADVESVEVFLDSESVVNIPAPQFNNFYQYWLTELPEGQHQLNIQASDNYGNSSNQLLNFNVDSTAPSITVTGIMDGGLYNNLVQANVVISDLNLSTSQIILDGIPYTAGADIDSNGNHILMVSATDLAGNTATSRHSFNIDLIAPVVVISYPLNNTETNQSTTTVSGHTEVNSTINLTNGPYSDNVIADFEGNFSFIDVPLISDNNIISVSATDLAGNVGLVTDVNVIYVDEISVSGLLMGNSVHPLGQDFSIDWQVINANNFVVSQLPVEVNLHRVSDNQLMVSDTHIITLESVSTFSEISVFGTNGLSPGNYRIELRVEIDQLWQLLDDHLTLLQDEIGPEIVVIEPIDSQVMSSTVDLLVLATDDHSQVVDVSFQLNHNGDWLPLVWNGLEYSSDIELDHDDYQIEFKAIDTFDNETITSAIQFAVDTNGPEINVITPTDGLISNQAVVIDYLVSDDHLFSADAQLNQVVTANGHSVEAEGEYELIVTATDEVNNESIVTRNFIVDTTAPILTVTSPNTDTQNTSGLLNITGVAEERNVITVRVNGVETTINTDSMGQFISSGHNLQIGMNLIEVTASDQAGNVSLPELRNVEYIQVGSIAGRVWQDDDQDSIIGHEESGFNHVALRLTDGNNNSEDIFTDMDGYYEFIELSPGQYTLEVIELVLLNQWQNTTNNTPIQFELTVSQNLEMNFGFYQDEPVIDTKLLANNLKGRLLILADPPIAQVDTNECVGVANYQLQSYIEHELIVGDTVWAKLFDSQGSLLQTETATFEDFVNNGYQTIDQQAETNDFNLLLHPVADRHLKASVFSSSTATPMILPAAYRLVLGLQTAETTTEWSSNMVFNECSVFAEIGSQSGELVLSDVSLNPNIISDDPNGSTLAPYLSSQYVMLRNLLHDAGWSYHISYDAADFATEMAGNQYVAYWLMAENILLTPPSQASLMTAVSNGAGILVSSGHDDLSAEFYSSMGVNINGYHLNATELFLLDSPIASGEVLDVTFDEEVLKVSLAGAESAAFFSGTGIISPENQAITWIDGIDGVNGINGSSVFSAIDWLLQATSDVGLNEYTKLIKNVLEYIHPLGLSNELSYVRAVRLNMQNVGRPVNGYVQVLLPSSLSLIHTDIPTLPNQDGFTFEYDLLVNQSLELDFWIKVDSSPATLTFEIHLNDEVSIFESLELTLVAGERPDLSVGLTNCQAGVSPGQLLMYRYQVTNTGNKDIAAAMVYTDFGVELQNPTWTCSGSLGGICGESNGSGNLQGQNIDLPVGSIVNFAFDTQVMVQQPSMIAPSAYIIMPEGVSDINPSNNSTLDVDSVYQFIFKNSFECVVAGNQNTKKPGVVIIKEGH